MKLKLFLILLAIASIDCEISNQLLNSMKQEAAKISSTMPSNYSSLVTTIQADSIDGFDSSSVADFDSMLAKYNFATNIVNQFKMAIISQSIEFQTFQVELTQNYSDIQEFIGAASNYNGNINIAFLQVYSEGTPVPQYESYHCCHTCWLVSKCCNTCHKEIGMTNSQMEIVTNALRATAYTKTMEFLNNPSSSFGNYSQEQQKLQDENAWDKLMTSEEKCEIQAGSDCDAAFTNAYDECAKKYSSKDYDDIATCAIQKIQITTFWKPCFLCLCANFYFNKKITLTKTKAECFHLYYPNDPELM